MPVIRNSFMTVLLMFIVATTFNFTFGDDEIEEKINKCKADMRTHCHCDDDDPRPVKCARMAFLYYRRDNTDIPDHIHEYFCTIVQQNYQIGGINEPAEYCDRKTYEEDEHLLESEVSLEDIDNACLDQLAVFIDQNPPKFRGSGYQYMYMLKVAFLETDLNSNLEKPFAELFLHYISRSITGYKLAYDLEPNSWCEYYMTHGHHPHEHSKYYGHRNYYSHGRRSPN